jgi:glutamate N-acetyltransferase/amino-acid N-acetyltransferase
VSVTAASGFVAAGIRCGIRRNHRDLAVIRSAVPATGGGMFTVNRVQAAPVKLSRRHLDAAAPQAVVVNSGVANAATGPQGDTDAEATAAHAARLLEIEPEQVIVLSTGVIGAPLPMEKVLRGVTLGVRRLDRTGDADAAAAILTTDTCPKLSVVQGDGFTVGGMAKGSGMIHPVLATMLAVLTTDYPLGAGEAAAFLRPAVDTSFNSISIDGECSTNDAVVLLANGASGVTRDDESDAAFATALQTACADLAEQIVADGEGATVLAEIDVVGAASDGEARAIAQRIATSPLVKTALFGRDANWGRIIAAAGSAPWNGGFAHVDPDRLTLRYNGTTVLASGSPQAEEPDLSGSACRIELELAIGRGRASYLTSDLSYDYVRINSDYRT